MAHSCSSPLTTPSRLFWNSTFTASAANPKPYVGGGIQADSLVGSGSGLALKWTLRFRVSLVLLGFIGLVGAPIQFTRNGPGRRQLQYAMSTRVSSCLRLIDGSIFDEHGISTQGGRLSPWTLEKRTTAAQNPVSLSYKHYKCMDLRKPNKPCLTFNPFKPPSP